MPAELCDLVKQMVYARRLAWDTLPHLAREAVYAPRPVHENVAICNNSVVRPVTHRIINCPTEVEDCHSSIVPWNLPIEVYANREALSELGRKLVVLAGCQFYTPSPMPHSFAWTHGCCRWSDLYKLGSAVAPWRSNPDSLVKALPFPVTHSHLNINWRDLERFRSVPGHIGLNIHHSLPSLPVSASIARKRYLHAQLRLQLHVPYCYSGQPLVVLVFR
ncbi:hypothetical protein PSPO01_05509 [Paraphaeosphaeria sporulosa]